MLDLTLPVTGVVLERDAEGVETEAVTLGRTTVALHRRLYALELETRRLALR
jgi:hypothetical protein